MLGQELFHIPESALYEYAENIDVNYKSKTAKEETYYPDLKIFLEKIFPSNKGYLVQASPKVEGSTNKPDFSVIFNGIVIFYIEAKLPYTKIKDIIVDNKKNRLKDQIKRYRSEGVQLLITDFIDILLIDSSVPNESDTQKIKFECRLLNQIDNKFRPAKNALSMFNRLLIQTCEDNLETITNIQKLINPLANIAIGIRNKTLYLLKSDNLSITEKIASNYLSSIRDDFKKSIFKEEIENEDSLFSDLFAQTIVYGAFSAWMNFCQKLGSEQDFNLQIVGDFLPYGSFIRELFLTLKNKTPEDYKGILKELEKRFQKTEYKGKVNTESIITTFYSDFLNLYDPITAKNRGVVYTPHEIVDYIINGIDKLLKNWLEKPDGLISEDILEKDNQDKKKISSKQININESLHKIHSKSIKRLRILDPAAGTMAFACGLLHHAKDTFYKRFDQSSLARSAFEKWVKETFFSNIYAFEILMAPYVLGHIRTFITLDNLDLSLNSQQYQLKYYLMNTLMTPPKGQPIESWIFNNIDIGREIKEALKIRNRKDIFVIMGNPPYSLTSQNNCKWINEKIDDYKVGLKEKNLKILSDDYVKFIRFGQWKIENVGTGILAFITNNRYLEGQVFSKMRQSLRKTFDRIYIVNLHGDMRKKETGNPFNIRVGVAIAFMVRFDNTPNKNGAIFYLDVPQLSRDEKFAILNKGFNEHDFKLLTETSKNFFIDIDTTYLDRYENFFSFDSLFKSSPMSGIMAGRDRLVYDVDENTLKEKISLFFNRKYEDLEKLRIKVNDTKTWKKSKVFSGTNLEKAKKNIKKINYRGWDYRYLVYDKSLLEGHRMGYVDQISERNPAITVTKSSRKNRFETAFIVENPLEKCFMAITDTSYVFPLYLYEKLNINKPDLPYQVKSKDVFNYCYGILYANTYRKRYDEYLRKGFPRIPFPKEAKLFQSMAEKGYKLIQIHLMREKISINFELSDSKQWIIRDYIYIPNELTLYFDKPSKNEDSKNSKIAWIKGITPEIWDYSIGMIKQIDQFLKSRKYNPSKKYNHLRRGLNHDELIYLLKLITAIEKTLEILPNIDVLYKKIDILD